MHCCARSPEVKLLLLQSQMSVLTQAGQKAGSFCTLAAVTVPQQAQHELA